MNPYYEMLNEKLLAALPAARKVLELGCAAGRLGQAYKQQHSNASWHGIDIHQPALEAARQHLDRVWRVDLDTTALTWLPDDYDCVVMGDVLEHLKEPERVLEELREITTENARLICCVPNGAHISIVERILVGDLSYEPAGLLDRTHLRQYTLSSLYKMLLDAGWLPQLIDQNTIDHPDNALTADVMACFEHVRASPEFAARTLSCYQMIVSCKKAEWPTSRAAASVSVIVPVNNELQFQLNAARSPGLAEITSELITCRNARNAAAAFAAGQGQAKGEWLLFCHQDTYFPRNSGFMLSQALATMPADAVVGFVGIGEAGHAGLVVDRADLYDWPTAERAFSIDELAVLLHRDTRLELDPELGWDLWATDLCLQEMTGRIVRVPVFHNSLTGHSLPPRYAASAEKLIDKYPDLSAIPTLCGTLTPAGG